MLFTITDASVSPAIYCGSVQSNNGLNALIAYAKQHNIKFFKITTYKLTDGYMYQLDSFGGDCLQAKKA